MTQIKRSAGQSAVAAAAYRAGEKLHSEYYGEISDYTRKGGVVCSEILLPSHAPPEYADRETLWNAVEKAERGKKAQLAYSFDIALQNEFSMQENIDLARQFLLRNFVSRGMVVDFAVHQPDKENGGISNPHFHVMCPIRPIEPDGKWGKKQRREYVLDEHGERVLDEAGNYVFNAVPTTDWGKPETLEAWRQAWADLCNQKFAENELDCRIDHRSYERQGIDQIPTVHVGVSATQMEKKGIVTERGELNRSINAANRILREIRRLVRGLKDWIAELKERKAALLEALAEARAQASEPTIPQLLARYMEQRGEERADWTSKGKLKGAVSDFNKVQAAMEFLRQKEISTVETLDRQLDGISETAVAIRDSMRKAERRIKDIDTLLSHIGNYEKYKPVYKEYAAIGWKKQKEKFAEAHRGELDAYLAAARYVKTHLPGTSYSRKELEAERKDLAAALPGKREELEAVQALSLIHI